MKTIFFDAGPIISLVMSRLDWILPELKKHFNGKFYITPAVKVELIDRPLKIRRFGFEALQVMKHIREGTLEVYKQIPQTRVNDLKKLANSSFRIGKKNMDIIQAGEMESVASALQIESEAVVMDERTLRLFIENHKAMEKLLEIRFKKDVIGNSTNMKKFSDQLKNVKIIRSIELVSTAYKLGILDGYIPKLKTGRQMLVNSILWTTKFNGCAVTTHEIEELERFLLKNNPKSF
tara:strand:- start:709 stop:1413 length:705 start_codon:yes stop_codon:yes gene_type:complete